MEKQSKLVFLLKKMAKESHEQSQKQKISSKNAIKAERMSYEPQANQKYIAELNVGDCSMLALKRKPQKNQNSLYRSMQSHTGATQSERSKVEQQPQAHFVVIKNDMKKNPHLEAIEEDCVPLSQQVSRLPLSSQKKRERYEKNQNFVKTPNRQDQVSSSLSQHLNTYIQFQQFVSKISEQSKKNNRKCDSPDYQDIKVVAKSNKRCSIIPALKPPNYRQKTNKSSQKQHPNGGQLQAYLKRKKNKLQLQKSLVIESKKQELTSHFISRQKSKNTLRRQERLKTFDNGSINLLNNIKDPTDKQIEEVQELLRLDQAKNSKDGITPKNRSHRTKQSRNISFFNVHSEEGVYDQKIRSYREFIFLVNLAHKVFDPLTILDYASIKQEKVNLIKPTYYIGPGNNSMLVRSLMKRRIWWQEVKSYENANFVWTQLKIPNIFYNQHSFGERVSDKNDSQQVIIVEAKDQEKQEEVIKVAKKGRLTPKEQMSTDKILISEKCSYSVFQHKKQLKINTISSKVPKGLMFRAPFAVQFQQKILTDLDVIYYRRMQDRVRGDLDTFEPRLKYFPKDYLTQRVPNDKIQMHNHFECNHNLGNKKALFYHMQLYYKLTNKPINKAFPNTYHIRMGESDPQFKKFLEEYQRISREEKYLKNIWILKPGENSNRGCGITVIKDLRVLRKLLRMRQRHRNGEQKTFILQKYIERPLLYRGRKFDIRHYMIISGIHGRLRAYWYGQGYVRTSSYFFNLEEVSDPMIHLTNDAIQKDCEEYGCYQEGNKVSYNQLQKYFSKELPQKKFDLTAIFGKMRELGRDAVLSTYVSIDPNSKLHNFQVFGLDFMIDEKMQVMLIEVNTNPCLQLSCTLLSRIIPLMLQQSLRIALDPIFPPPAHYTNNTRHLAPDCNLQKLQMELIFDSGRDGQALTKLYEKNKEEYDKMMTMLKGSQKDLDEVFEDEGIEIEIDKFIT